LSSLAKKKKVMVEVSKEEKEDMEEELGPKEGEHIGYMKE